MFGNWRNGKNMTLVAKKKDLRKQIKEVNDKIIAIETGIETDEYDTNPSLATPITFKQLEEEVDEEDDDSDDRTIAELEKELEDANKKLSEANADEEEIKELNKETDDASILEKEEACIRLKDNRANQNKCLEELNNLLTNRITAYKTSGDSLILINLDELQLKFNRISIEYNNKLIELTELKKKTIEGVEDKNFKKSLSEAREILKDKTLIRTKIDNIQQHLNELIKKNKRINDIFRRRRLIAKSISEKDEELKRFNGYSKNPRRQLTKQEEKKINTHILTLTGEILKLKELAKQTELFKGGRTRRMKKNVKKITNKKKTSIKAKTRRIRRRITTCRGRKTFRRRN